MAFAWSKFKGIPSQGAGEVLSAFVERYGDLHEAGTYHLRSGVVEEDAYREGLMAWFRKSPSSAGDYEKLSDLNRRVYALMRETFQDDAEARQLSSKESEELFEWLAEVGQQNVELDWLLNHWEREWRPSGLEPDEIEKFLRRL